MTPQLSTIHLDFVWFNELCIGVDVVHVLVPQRHPVAPVQRANVVVDCILHGIPVVFHCRQTDTQTSLKPGSSFRDRLGDGTSAVSSLTRLVKLPTKLSCVLDGCSQQGRLVHQFLGDAADVHAGSTET